MQPHPTQGLVVDGICITLRPETACSCPYRRMAAVKIRQEVGRVRPILPGMKFLDGKVKFEHEIDCNALNFVPQFEWRSAGDLERLSLTVSLRRPPHFAAVV